MAAALPEFPVRDYVLVTSRDVSAQVWAHHGRRNTPFDDLGDADRKWLNVPAGQIQETEKEFGSVEAAARACHSVLQNLSIYSRVGADHWLEALRKYATERGLYDEEFEPALSRLVGDALRTTVKGPAEFSQGWLNRCLFGSPNIRSLRIAAPDSDSARCESAVALESWLTRQVGSFQHSLVRREYLRDLSDQLIRYPVVLVLGGGGCGKSTLAAQFLLEFSASRFVAAVSARDLGAFWLGQAFNTWRHPESARQRPPGPDDDVPRRLRYANPDAPSPILVVDIDGLDEKGDRSWDHVRNLVALCDRQGHEDASDMSLIRTARATAPEASRARRNLLGELFSADYPSDHEDQFGLVIIDDFSETEFRAVLQQHPDPSVRGRLQIAAETTAGTTVAETEALLDMDLASPDLIASLRHPVLWGTFSRLCIDEQQRVLNGAFDPLSAEFVERFCMKTNRRRPTLHGERVRRALIRIARLFPAHQTIAGRQTDWVAPAAQLITEDEAAFLFDEAISYGMIREEEPGQWTWRHRFLRESLAAWEERR
jgi:hypothetical protein